MAVVFPAKGDLAFLHGHQSPVGNGHAMGIAAQIHQDLTRPAEWWLGVNHPLFFAQRGQIGVEVVRVNQAFEFAEKLQSPRGVEGALSFQKETAEKGG